MSDFNEFVIEWISGQKTASVTFPSNSRWANKIRNLAEKTSDVSVIEDKNGYLFAHIPVEYLAIRKPKVMTEEMKAQALKNLGRVK